MARHKITRIYLDGYIWNSALVSPESVTALMPQIFLLDLYAMISFCLSTHDNSTRSQIHL